MHMYRMAIASVVYLNAYTDTHIPEIKLIFDRSTYNVFSLYQAHDKTEADTYVSRGER